MSASILANSPAKMLTTVLFVVSFNSLFVVAYKNCKKFPSFTIFSALLWLGFFGKTTMLLTFGRGIKDPIGAFDGQWDELFTVVSTGVLALIASFFLYAKMFPSLRSVKVDLEGVQAKLGFKFSLKMALIYVSSLMILALLNLKYGFILSGLASITHLPFKITAIIGWMFYLGFSITLAHFFMSSKSTNKLFFICVGLLFAEGFFSSVALISRGTFIFHVVPVLALIAYNKKNLRLSIKSLAIMFVVFCAMMVVTVGAVTMARNALYDKYAFSNTEFSNPVTQYLHKIDRTFVSDAVGVIGDLMVNRWVGLEGAMAVVGYPEKNIDLMIDSLTRIPRIGVQDVYAKISGVVYEDNPKINFSFIPGPIAFLYYSGKLLSVFLGLAFLGFFLMLADDIVWRSFKNPFLTAQIATYLAVNASQIGISPLPLLKSLILTVLGLIVARILFSSTFVSAYTTQLIEKIWPLELKAK